MTNHSIEQLNRVRRRHLAFWNMDDVDSPLMYVGPYQEPEPGQPLRLSTGSQFEEGSLIDPDQLDAREIAAQKDQTPVAPNDDFLSSISSYGLCWNEAVAGCPIRWRSGSVWAEPVPDILNHVELLRVKQDNPWLNKLLQTIPFLKEWTQGLSAIHQPLLRGPIDIMAALLGDQTMCYVLADKPEQSKELLMACTDLFVHVARRWWSLVPPLLEGYCIYDLWTPGTPVRMQCDNAALLSPEWYRDFLIPCDEEICKSFEYPVMHTHSVSVEIVADALIELKSLRAIQVGLDYPAGPPLERLLPYLQKINKAKPLIITGTTTGDQLKMMLDTLSPRGLSLQIRIPS